jgi:hypothetical protein
VAAVDIKTLYTIKKRGKSRENNDLMTKITKNKAKKSLEKPVTYITT